MDTVILVLTVAGVVAALGALVPNNKPKLRIATGVVGALLLGVAAAIYIIDNVSQEKGEINESGTGVQSCRRFGGSAELPDDRTILVTNKNLSNADVGRYARLPIGWDQPAELDEWSAVQYFGLGDANLGQKFQIDLIAVDLAAAKKYQDAFRKPGGLSGDESEKLIKEGNGKVLDTVYLQRIKGDTPDKCET